MGRNMSKSFFLAGDKVIFLANADGADLRYRAHAHTVSPQVQVPARVNERSETVFVVEHGSMEFMIGGAVGHVSAGGFVRVPAGVQFAYRNCGDEAAQLLSRCVLPVKATKRITFEIAAA